MKKLLLLLVVLFVYSIILDAQSDDSSGVDLCSIKSNMIKTNELISFKSLALGASGVDYQDQALDPIELNYLEGTRIFTNLSNNSGGDKLFSGQGDNQYVFGIATDNPYLSFLKNAVFFKFQSTKNGNAIAIDPAIYGVNGDNVSGVGELNLFFNSYIDNTGDGIFDLRETLATDKKSFTETNSSNFSFNNSLVLADYIIGAKYWMISNDTENNQASAMATEARYLHGITYDQVGGNIGITDASFNYSYNSFLYDGNFTNITMDENGNFLNKSENSKNNFEISIMKPAVFGYELRCDLGFSLNKISTTINDEYSGNKENFNLELEHFKQSIVEDGKYNMETSTDGYDAELGVSFRKVLKTAEDRIYDDFVETGVIFGVGIHDYVNDWSINKGMISTVSEISDSLNTAGESIDYVTNWTVQTISDFETQEDNGDQDKYSFMLYNKFNKHLNKDVLLVTSSSINYSYAQRNTDFMAYYLNNNENLYGTMFDENQSNYFDDGFDTRSKREELLNADRTYEREVYKFIASTGVEYRFTKSKNWYMRFGAIYSFEKSITNDKIQVTDQPNSLTEEHFDGDDNYSVINANNNYQSESNHNEISTSQTLFTYGLGYKPNENIAFDLVGLFDGSYLGANSTNVNGNNEDIFDLAYLKSIKLAISLKF